ncbi:MAG: helix-turn-helix transcriptional regulator [Faecalibacterium sp.]|nr:helix-turn-helix transcriptional regulator [Ruminococcus sp.]MCM1392937.1 helix-turn-helix transcriptional regulator [Ruminococcus sp.]MCM1485680.1 helix-turn-helix transcriptional regulator [Faecalibacterium sp.]
MDNIKPIITICEYGRIKIKLRAVMDEKGISRNQLSKLTNTRFEVVNKWYNGTVERIDADILARFCFTLNCNVSDIIEYQK